MLVDLSRYLFARTTGNIGSLMDLIRRGSSRAIRNGRELLDRELLDDIRIDEGAETERMELEVLIEKRHVQRIRRAAAKTEESAA
jgi:hypothetical protein